RNVSTNAHITRIWLTERIFGYKNFKIDMFCLSSSANFYLNIDYEEKINPKKYQEFKVDDLIESLNQWIQSTTTTHLDLFLSKLKNENEYAPFGEQILSYELNGEKSTAYLINRVNQKICDDKNSLSDIHCQIYYAPIGYSTVYFYYAYPNKKRPRISQVLTLPTYQRKDHGRRLLTAIYNDLRKDSRAQDITGIAISFDKTSEF
ncbi:unnamed protein product, partial [Rotaria socialis]